MVLVDCFFLLLFFLLFVVFVFIGDLYFIFFVELLCFCVFDLGFRVVGFCSVDVVVDEFWMIMNEMWFDCGGIVGFFVLFCYFV